MSKQVINLNPEELQKAVSTGLVLVDFWAPWCSPCKMQIPILDEVVAKVEGKAHIAKVDIDSHPEAASKYGVQSIPTLLLFKDGNVLERFVGLQSRDNLVSAIENNQ